MRRFTWCFIASSILAGCSATDAVAPSGTDPTGPSGTSLVMAMKDAFHLKELGALGGRIAYGEAINTRTQVTGGAETVDGFAHPFLWTPGRGMQDLGTLGGDNADASALNDFGDVVGGSQTGIADEDHAFLWVPGRGMRDLGTFGGPISFAGGLNNRRQVVGLSTTEAGRALPFLWEPGRGMHRIVRLSALEDEGRAWDINNAGQVVGQIVFGGFANGIESLAFLWSQQGGIKDLGNLGSRNAVALAINERGDVAGASDDASGGTQAFLWGLHRGMEGLGTLGGSFSLADGLNVHRVVVGGSTNEDDRQFLPFVWTRRIGMRALPIAEVGADGGQAEGINDRNEISGKVFLPDGTERAVLWRPRVDLLTASIADTPEVLFDVAVTAAYPAVRTDSCRLDPRVERLPRRWRTRLRECPD